MDRIGNDRLWRNIVDRSLMLIGHTAALGAADVDDREELKGGEFREDLARLRYIRQLVEYVR